MIDVRSWGLPFRVGATSYIVDDDLLPNAAFLASHVEDMQLVLFEIPGGPSNLPSPQDVAALGALGRARDLTYTVHLMHDLRLYDEDGEPALALAKARQVIELTLPLAPHAWVCHLDGRSVRAELPASIRLAAWQEHTAEALRQVCGWARSPQQVVVENLEGYAPEFVAPVVARAGAGRCIDAGHLWLDGRDPLPYLGTAQARLRVVHLHAVAPAPPAGTGRDHSSLAHAAPEQLDAVLAWLIARRFDGVLTLEVFGEDDFWSSLSALQAALARLRSTMEER